MASIPPQVRCTVIRRRRDRRTHDASFVFLRCTRRCTRPTMTTLTTVRRPDTRCSCTADSRRHHPYTCPRGCTCESGSSPRPRTSRCSCCIHPTPTTCQLCDVIMLVSPTSRNFDNYDDIFYSNEYSMKQYT